MNTAIFIVTYKKDFPYLKYCLRSIEKFASGYDEVVLLVPNEDFDVAVTMARQHNIPIAVRSGDEWKGKGMLWHMNEIMYADVNCPHADIILHMDADCIFTEPLTPLEYIQDGKPRLLYESFVSLNRRGITETDKWQICTQKCLPFDVLYETMRSHPEVYPRILYPMARSLVQQKVGIKIDDYIKSGRNEYPQEFCEFNTLGNVAIQCLPADFNLVNLEHEPWPKMKLYQGWGHQGLRTIDMDKFKELGLE